MSLFSKKDLTFGYLTMFEKELTYIKTDFIREQTKLAIDNFPSYFDRVMSSSTGKYHAVNETLYEHTCRDAKLGFDIVNLEMFELDELEKDLIISALILHDCCKYGREYHQYVTHDHPMIASKFVKDICDDSFADVVCPLIESHSGQWTTSKWSKVILPKPTTKLQKIVHLVDYIASRRYITVNLEEPIR